MSERRPSPAVYGVETEYSCLITLPGDVEHEIVGSCHSVDAQIGLYIEPESRGSSGIPDESISQAVQDMGIIRNSSGMLSNGGRLYIDPSGPEYATPETTTAEDAVHRVFEGDKILLDLFAKLREGGIVKGYQINRRAVDHNRSSRGVHLNTLTKLSNKEPSEQVAMWLATLNVAKGSLFGSGGLLVDEEGNTAYHHSPRLSITSNIAANYGLYQLRPLVRTPFKDDGERLARIETVTSDSLSLAWPLRASLIATNAVVGLIEMGYGDKLPMLREEEAIASAHNVGQYGADGLIVLEGKGKKAPLVRSIDVLRQIAELVLEVDHIEKHLDKESDQVIAEIIYVADKMVDDPYSVADQVESMARWVAIERKMERDGLPIDAERMCRFDYAWDWIGGGIAETLRSKGKLGWQGFAPTHSAATTKRRLITPPGDTRAKVRGRMIELQLGTDDSSWDVIDFGDEAKYMHPLSTTIPKDVELPEDLIEAVNG